MSQIQRFKKRCTKNKIKNFKKGGIGMNWKLYNRAWMGVFTVLSIIGWWQHSYSYKEYLSFYLLLYIEAILASAIYMYICRERSVKRIIGIMFGGSLYLAFIATGMFVLLGNWAIVLVCCVGGIRIVRDFTVKFQGAKK